MDPQIMLNPTHPPFNESIQDSFKITQANSHFWCQLCAILSQACNTTPYRFANIDDVLSGGHTTEEAKEGRIQLITDIDPAGLILRKWISNSTELLKNLPEEHLLDVNLLNFLESSKART